MRLSPRGVGVIAGTVGLVLGIGSAKADIPGNFEISGAVPGEFDITQVFPTEDGQSKVTELLKQEAAAELPEKAEPQKPKPKYKTGDLPRNRAVPLWNYRVGPLFGNRGPHTGGVHGGIDLGTAHGEPIFAISGGKVVAARWQGAAGLSVTIETSTGHLNLYGHMSSLGVSEGEKVGPGQWLGRIGSTGNSTGPHLHFQVNRIDTGEAIDPLPWLRVTARELARFGRD